MENMTEINKSYYQKSGEYIFYDYSAESPKGRQSLCYKREVLVSRKKHKPKKSTMDRAKMQVIFLKHKRRPTVNSKKSTPGCATSWSAVPVSYPYAPNAAPGVR